MARGDFSATICDEDAEVSLQLMREVLMEVYQNPAGRERLVSLARDARQARTIPDHSFDDEPPF